MTWLSANPYYEMFASRALFLAGYGGAASASAQRLWGGSATATSTPGTASGAQPPTGSWSRPTARPPPATGQVRGRPTSARPPTTEVDPDRLVLAGWSFSGYLAPRGAAFESERLAALWADPAAWDGRAMVASLPLADAEKARFPEGVVRPSSSRWRTTCAPTRPTRCSAGGSSSGGCGSTARTPCSTTSPRWRASSSHRSPPTSPVRPSW